MTSLHKQQRLGKRVLRAPFLPPAKSDFSVNLHVYSKPNLFYLTFSVGSDSVSGVCTAFGINEFESLLISASVKP